MITYPIVQKKEQETDDYIPNSVKEGTRNRWLHTDSVKEGTRNRWLHTQQCKRRNTKQMITPNSVKEGTRNRWLHTQ